MYRLVYGLQQELEQEIQMLVLSRAKLESKNQNGL
jgi:hypothetical protein